jgi:tetratricopeptide (TPR) repeat protein
MGLRELLRGWFSGSGGAQTDSPGGSLSSPLDTSEADKRCLEGAEHLAEGRLAEAEQALARALECRHDYVEALLLQSAVFREQRRFEEAADSLVLATHFRPDLAEAHYHLGVIAAARGRIDEAERSLRRAIAREPLHAKAQNALGALLSEQGAVDEAVSCFYRAIAARPELAQAHSNLGCLLMTELDQFDDGATHIEIAYGLAPDAPDVKCNWAMLLQYRGQFHAALTRWTELIDSGALANDAKARLDRAMIFLLLGQFREGWDDYEKRFMADPGTARDFGLPPWKGEPLADKTILVYAEQGIGDEIMFASCLSDLIAVAGRVIVECSDRLQAVFRRSFPLAMIRGGKKEDPADWLAQCGPVDYQVPIGSLPRRFRPERGSFPGVYPYLQADARRVEDWRVRLRREGAGPAIGISWRGGTAGTRSQIRSVPPELLAKTLRPGFTWVNLQHGSGDAQPLVPGLRTFPGVTSDLDDLAALMGALDLVVTVDNTNVHLAGALGRPVWVLLSGSPEWRYGASGDTMPWYPSARLFRRNQNEGWDEVLASLVLELEHLFGPSANRTTPA